MTLTCEGCSYEVEEYADEEARVGRCCHNLAAPWHRGREGLYTETTPRGEEPEDLDGSGEPECSHCGSTTFEYLEEQTVWRSVLADEGTLYVGDSYDSYTSATRLQCESCGEQYHGNWEYE
jgi:hypothetical protein